MKQIPTYSEWRSVPWCLDIRSAYDHFFGKAIAEAQQLFEESAIDYQEDLMFMPTPCLRYYITAYLQYLLSDRSSGDSDGAFCFFGLVEIRHSDINRFDSETVDHVKAVLQKLGTHQEWYVADPAIYGDFATKAQCEIVRLSNEC